jgi:threonine dehydrogenase-like Zn-dependent dehydrogenase
MDARAARYVEPGRLEVRRVDVPEPAPGEVRIRVGGCGVCGSDLHFFSGAWDPPKDATPGHEVSGVVESVGVGVSSLAIGHPVSIEPLRYCGECEHCLGGAHNQCEEGGFFIGKEDGGFGELMIAPAMACHPVPDGVTLEEAALGEPLAVAIHAIRQARVGSGLSVGVIGAGTIGLLAVAAARAAGAGTIIASARHPHQAKAARLAGADAILPTEGDAFVSAAEEACPGGVDVVVETVGGSSEPVAQAMALARKRGTVVFLGGFPGPIEMDPRTIVYKELHVIGSFTYARPGPGLRSDFQLALDWMAARRVDVAAIITHRLPLDEIQRAHEIAADKSSGSIKVVVKPAQEPV